MQDLYERVNLWMSEEENDGDNEAALAIATMALSEVCGSYVASYTFINKKSDGWAETCLNGISSTVVACYQREMDSLIDNAEDENGEAKVN